MKRLPNHLLAAAAVVVALALAACGTPVKADGLWEGLPQGGVAANSQCINTNNGVCTVFAPAGPSAMTGLETFPADTHLSGGRNPQSAKYTAVQLGAGAIQFSVPLAGGTITVSAATSQVIIDPAGTLATLTLQLPAASGLVDGQRLGFCTTQIITALTVTDGAGAVAQNKPTAMLVPVATGAASCVEWIYVQSQLKWYRTQ